MNNLRKPGELSPVSPIQQLDKPCKLAALAAASGLIVLVFSPWFTWFHFFETSSNWRSLQSKRENIVSFETKGGGIGFSASEDIIGFKTNEGKIIFAVTLAAIAAFVAAAIEPKRLKHVVLAIQGWGTAAAFWMASFIWKTTFHPFYEPSNLFGPVETWVTTLIRPETGLYLGLSGTVVVAAALACIVVRRPAEFGGLNPYFASQFLSVLIGILLVCYTDPSNPFTFLPGG